MIEVDFSYIGCYIDKDLRDLSGYFQNIPYLTPYKCAKRCASFMFKYFGLQNGYLKIKVI